MGTTSLAAILNEAFSRAPSGPRLRAGDRVHLELGSGRQMLHRSSDKEQSGQEDCVRKKRINWRSPSPVTRYESEVQDDVAGRADSGAKQDLPLHSPGDEGVAQVRAHEVERYGPGEQKQQRASRQELVSKHNGEHHPAGKRNDNRE